METKALLEGDLLTQAASDAQKVCEEMCNQLLTGDPYGLDATAAAGVATLCGQACYDIVLSELGEPAEEVAEESADEKNIRAGRKINAKDLGAMKDAIKQIRAGHNTLTKIVNSAIPTEENSIIPEDKGTTTIEKWTDEEIKNLFNV